MAQLMEQHKAIRVISLFEALKGFVVLLAAAGFLSLLHKDLYAIAINFVEHTHLNPASKYPQIFLDAASHTHDSRLLALALGAAGYSTVRLFEAYGLFFGRAWAEVLAAASGAIYFPIELLGLARHATWTGAFLFIINFAVVTVMVHALLLRRRARASNARSPVV